MWTKPARRAELGEEQLLEGGAAVWKTAAPAGLPLLELLSLVPLPHQHSRLGYCPAFTWLQCAEQVTRFLQQDMILVAIITQEMGVLVHALKGDHPEVAAFSVCLRKETQQEDSSQA